MKLVFTATARQDLIRLREFIAKKNPLAAQKYSQQLIKQIKSLLKQPLSGKLLEDVPKARELVARTYIIHYQLLENKLIILKVWYEKESRY